MLLLKFKIASSTPPIKCGLSHPLSTSLLKAIIIGIIVILGACTNSKLLLTPLYNQLDNQLDRTLLSLVDLDKQQKQELTQLTDTFHAWHRQSELPRYSTFLASLANKLNDKPNTASIELPEQLILTVRELREAVFTCHPINYAADLLKSLSNTQIDQFQAAYLERQQERRDDIRQLNEAQRIKKATKNAKKWIARANLTLNAEQSAVLREAISKQMRPDTAFVEDLDKWSEHFFKLLRQHNPIDNFEEQYALAIQQRWQLFESANPEVVQKNRSLWLNYTKELVASLTPKQRSRFSKWLRKMASTLADISEQTPQYKPTDSNKGCLAG